MVYPMVYTWKRLISMVFTWTKKWWFKVFLSEMLHPTPAPSNGGVFLFHPQKKDGKIWRPFKRNHFGTQTGRSRCKKHVFFCFPSSLHLRCWLRVNPRLFNGPMAEYFRKWRIQNLWSHACCISANHTPNHAPESNPRIIPRIISMIAGREGETYPETYPRNIPPKHTSNHTLWCNTLCWARSFRKGHNGATRIHRICNTLNWKIPALLRGDF